MNRNNFHAILDEIIKGNSLSKQKLPSNFSKLLPSDQVNKMSFDPCFLKTGLTLSQTSPGFLHVCSTNLFPQCFLPVEELFATLIKFGIVVCKLFQFGRVINLWFGKVLMDLPKESSYISLHSPHRLTWVETFHNVKVYVVMSNFMHFMDP